MAFVGVLMLETRFPRPPGDIGNPATFARLGIPVRYQVVPGASPERVVRRADAALLPCFLEAAQGLVSQGATLITTSCGFLAPFQAEMQAAVAVPVLTSSLLWIRRLRSPCAVLTIDADALTALHLLAAGAAPDTPAGGVAQGCEFQAKILGNVDTLDLRQAGRDVVEAAMKLVARFPATQTLVLECTNMPPYADAVAEATGRRVEHIMTLIEKLWTH